MGLQSIRVQHVTSPCVQDGMLRQPTTPVVGGGWVHRRHSPAHPLPHPAPSSPARIHPACAHQGPRTLTHNTTHNHKCVCMTEATPIDASHDKASTTPSSDTTADNVVEGMQLKHRRQRMLDSAGVGLPDTAYNACKQLGIRLCLLVQACLPMQALLEQCRHTYTQLG